MGRTDETFEWLERAYEERDAFLLYLHGERWWSPAIVQDARYQDFWDRMQFPSSGSS